MSQKRVLLADDEPQVRTLVRAFLASAHFDVVEAGDGAEALSAIERAAGLYDLLITDIKMPVMDGFALAHSVAKDFPHIPVLFISGFMPDPVFPEGAGEQRWAFLGKPFQPKALFEKVTLLLAGGSKLSRAAGS
jgi:CheY-like chemotaxis protein